MKKIVSVIELNDIQLAEKFFYEGRITLEQFHRFLQEIEDKLEHQKKKMFMEAFSVYSDEDSEIDRTDLDTWIRYSQEDRKF